MSKLATFAFLVAFFGFCFKPIWDSDTWWHIASGQWIVKNHQIPSTDPFGVYSTVDRVRNDTVLRGQWGGQVLLYFAEEFGGNCAVIFLRASILTLTLFLMLLRARSSGASMLASWLVLIPTALLALGYTSDRPQLFSYLFAALVFALVDRFVSVKNGWILAPIPVIGVLWSNIHAGFLIAVATLAIYCSMDAMSRLAGMFREKEQEKNPAEPPVRRSDPKVRNYSLYAVTVIFVTASLLNANGLTTYSYLFDFEGTNLQNATSEYMSSFRLHEFGYYLPQVWIVLIFSAGVVSCFGLFKHSKSELAVLVFLLFAGAFYYRYFAFVSFISGPYIAVGLSTLFRPSLSERLENALHGVVAATAVVALVIGISYQAAFSDGVDKKMFPVEAMDSLGKSPGKIFNHMQWGGFLLWKLNDAAHIYIDGRVLDREKYARYTNMLWATPPGLQLFEEEHFDVVAIPASNRFTGERYPLPMYLEQTHKWDLVFERDGNLVYRRKVEN